MLSFCLIALLSLQLNLVYGLVPACEPGWEHRENKCYKLIYPPSPGDAVEHVKLCSKLHQANAVRISSQAENDFVVDLAVKTLKADGKFPQHVWLVTGGLRPPGGTLSWETGDGNKCPLTFNNWGPGEPTGDGSNLALYLDASKAPFATWANSYYGKWNDYTSTTMDIPVMCEKVANGVKCDCTGCTPDPPPPEPETCGGGVLVGIKDDCIKIKLSTLTAILASCACGSP